jgi:diguanylate cyclase (GGDEF)-like protein
MEAGPTPLLTGPKLPPGDASRRSAARQTNADQRRALFAVALLNLSAIAVDALVLGDNFHIAMALRLLVMPLVVWGLALNRWSNNGALQATINAATLVALAVSVAVIGQLAPEPFASRYMMAAQFIIFGSALFSALPWRHTQIITMISTIAYMAVTASALQFPPAWTNLDFVGFGVLNGVLALVARRRRDAHLAELDFIRRNDAELKRELRAANEALSKLSNTDALTGTFNRRYLDELITHDATSIVPSSYQGVLMIDVDHFKLFNDHGGHPEGDRCLRQVAAALCGNVRPAADTVVRYGGEEFAVVLPETDESETLRIAERLRRAVSDLRISHPGLEGAAVVTVSIGAAIAAPAENLGEAIARADRSLYRAKQAGRNRVGGMIEHKPEAMADHSGSGLVLS